ncbi:DNA helicase RecQ [Parvularcula lutaonensis]|uniref:DNA helicase RecQ n=1 Tax=Parvularcula lutaonensis TaxID=491923 RepID=A0ABV7MF80_9PROT|nr:DNA helicase RecQ [Parvularcula lutaonensis]GGY54277.1 ATP-dependent DNA helicase RecQ [Parvularcula lutaonensis]
MVAVHERDETAEDPRETLREVFGFEDFRPGQKPVVDALLSGQNVLAVMPTGAGKSLCFQVPALMRPGFAVVVSPLIALMQNQVALLQSFGAPAGMLHSGRTREENVADWKAAVAGEIKLLYMSPERLATERMQAALAKADVSLFVIDEAHCISQWGHDFRPEYLALENLKTLKPGTPVAAFTATADEDTRADMVERLFAGNVETFVSGFDRPNLTLSVEEKSGPDKRIEELLHERRGQQGIVYCGSRKNTENLAEKLSAAGHNAIAYHAGLPDEERGERLNRFLSEPDLVVCATIAFGMGIDKPDIRYVIHRDMPASPEAYYQEIGRAGRDGRPAEAILLYSASDLMFRRRMIDDGGAPEDIKRHEKRKLDILSAYCEALTCRRNLLLGYFGEMRTEPCGKCDVCIDPPKTEDATADARLFLEAAMETGEVYGQAHLIDVLRGAETEKVLKAKHDDLTVFARGTKRPAKSWRSLVGQLFAQGYVEMQGEYRSIVVTPQGRGFLNAGGSVSLKKTRAKETTQALKKTQIVVPPDFDEELLGRLKAKRLELAKAKGAPAYTIFSDRTLIDMAVRQPTSQAELLAVYGVGLRKAEVYGETFLEVIRG